MSCDEDVLLSRRKLLAGGGATLALWGLAPRRAMAGARDPRLLCVILRGGLDGLSMVAPVGDPEYAALRGSLAIPRAGQGAGLPLDGFFALNARMPRLHALYRGGEALLAHAVATPYRGRSHFDGQDVLESGLAGVGRSEDGWLNRALSLLPASGPAMPAKGLSIGAMVPLVMRGKAPVLTWIDKANRLPLRPSTIKRLLDLYAHGDPGLQRALAEGVEINRMAGGDEGYENINGRRYDAFLDAAEAAARFMSADGGPRIGALAYNGWDTHANEGAVDGVLARRLEGLDMAIAALRAGLGPAWRDTVVLVVTEFGRTARINGTKGTDHGTATLALLVGGAVKGGRMLTDWPGLGQRHLYEGRDLMPTRDMRALVKGVLRDHLGFPEGLLAGGVFPGSAGVAVQDGLIA